MLEDKVAYIHTYIHTYVCTYISDCSKKLKSKDSKTLPLSTCAVGFEASAQAKLCCGAHSGRGIHLHTNIHTYICILVDGHGASRKNANGESLCAQTSHHHLASCYLQISLYTFCMCVGMWVYLDCAHHIISGRNVDDETGLSGNYTQIKKYVCGYVYMFVCMKNK